MVVVGGNEVEAEMGKVLQMDGMARLQLVDD
jgi:hypothetical protein